MFASCLLIDYMYYPLCAYVCVFVYVHACIHAFNLTLYIFFILQIYDIKFIYIFYSNSCIQDIGPGGLEHQQLMVICKMKGSAASLD